MWKSVVGHKSSDKVLKPSEKNEDIDDSWDTDPDFVNTVSEKEQRWGSKTIQGSGRLDSINIAQLREEVKKDDEIVKKKEYEESPIKYSLGYGGKYGVQYDRLDKSAVGFEYNNDKNSPKLSTNKTIDSVDVDAHNSELNQEIRVTEIKPKDESKPTVGKLDFKALKSRFENN